MLFKYALDTMAVSLVTRHFFPPLAFFNPLLSERLQAMGSAPTWLPWSMAVWSLPFLWVGIAMSVRRSASAGFSPWWGLGFVVPGLNYLVIISLSLVGDRPDTETAIAVAKPNTPAFVAGTIAVVSGTTLAVGLVLLSVKFFAAYGAALFFLSPLVIGVVVGVLFNRPALQSASATAAMAALTVFLSGGAIILFAFEGLICLLMAAPIALFATVLGALMARAVLARRPPRQVVMHTALLLLCLPVLTAAETQIRPAPLLSVTTSIDIAAPPERVWPHVIAFSELPPPSELIFKTGIAYPLRATIIGTGVGAERHCEFSTGPFVEPITVWEEPHRLAFDVRSQPPSMFEWSPYANLHPLHLDGYLKSRRGEFMLTRTPEGGTHLTGTTWYTIDIHPIPYWSLFSDLLIHTIHERVLSHIAADTMAAG